MHHFDPHADFPEHHPVPRPKALPQKLLMVLGLPLGLWNRFQVSVTVRLTPSICTEPFFMSRYREFRSV